MDPALALRGFRIPCVIISPFSALGTVAHGAYDRTSVLELHARRQLTLRQRDSSSRPALFQAPDKSNPAISTLSRQDDSLRGVDVSQEARVDW